MPALWLLVVMGTPGCQPDDSDRQTGAPLESAVTPERGAELFRRKGCMACHKLEGSMGAAVGPNLGGVTERRDSAWFHHMVMEPDSMVRADSIAHALWRQYGTAMPDLELVPDQVASIWAFLRERDAGEGATPRR